MFLLFTTFTGERMNRIGIKGNFDTKRYGNANIYWSAGGGGWGEAKPELERHICIRNSPEASGEQIVLREPIKVYQIFCRCVLIAQICQIHRGWLTE